MAAVTPPSLGCTHGLAGSCDGLTKSSTNPTRTDDGEEHFGLPVSLMSLSGFRAGSSRCMPNGLCVCVVPPGLLHQALQSSVSLSPITSKSM